MLNCFKKTTVMSVEEFLQLERGQMTLKEIRNNQNGETFTNKIMKNNRVKKFTCTLLGLSLYFKTVYAAGKGINGLGWTLLGLIREWAYWILLIWCIVEIIRAGVSGESKKTLPIVMKYVIIFASMYLIPGLFDAIKNSF